MPTYILNMHILIISDLLTIMSTMLRRILNMELAYELLLATKLAMPIPKLRLLTTY